MRSISPERIAEKDSMRFSADVLISSFDPVDKAKDLPLLDERILDSVG